MSIWANPEKIGLIIMRGNIPFYLDAGPDYDAAVASGPAPYGGPVVDDPVDVVPIEGQPIGIDPEAIGAARQVLADSLGISVAALADLLVLAVGMEGRV